MDTYGPLTRAATLAAFIVVLTVCASVPRAETSSHEVPADVQAHLQKNFPASALQRRIAPSPPETKDPVADNARKIYFGLVRSVAVLAFGNQKLGAGILLSADGTMLTNQHVVAGAYEAKGQRWLSALFIKSVTQPVVGEPVAAKVMKENIGHDLAVVKVMGPLPAGAIPVSLSRLDARLADRVFAFGHPEGFLWTFSPGAVIQVRPGHPWKYEDGVQRQATLVQFDAAVASGSSGGPLLNEAGDLVGIVAWHDRGNPRLAFAVALEHLGPLLKP